MGHDMLCDGSKYPLVNELGSEDYAFLAKIQGMSNYRSATVPLDGLSIGLAPFILPNYNKLHADMLHVWYMYLHLGEF